MNLRLSALGHTWLIDLDGTVLRHNGHKAGADSLLDGVSEFWSQIPEQDKIILLSARSESEAEASLAFLTRAGLRYDEVLFGLPAGERIVLNDVKPGGLETSIAVNLKRDHGLGDCRVLIDEAL